MNSYDYLMGNIQAALRQQGKVMKARKRKSKIKDLYEKYKNSSTIGKIKNKNGVCFGPYRFSEN